MIVYNYESNFTLKNKDSVSEWIINGITKEDYKEGEINYIFCDDKYLLEINNKYLNHNTLTDIISFDYSLGKLVSGDIFISVDRVKENAKKFHAFFEDELHRVMIHGILHFCRYNDKTKDEKKLMRSKEDYYLSLRAF